MTILIAGGTGFLGRAIHERLLKSGHEVRILTRGHPHRAGAFHWDPLAGDLPPAACAGVDGCVNLAGENIGAGRWTEARRRDIRESRLASTRLLVRRLAESARRPCVLVNASAVGYYGDQGDTPVDERHVRGDGFLAEVCGAWEQEASNAAEAGIRTVIARFGLVLGAGGGALDKMRPVFRAGLGGRLGSGRQWMSWIHRDDAAAAVAHLLHQGEAGGAFNVVAPEPVTNAVFTQTLGRVLQRPTAVTAPAAALRLIFGQMAEETLLASTRAVPARLVESGFAFQYAQLEPALRSVTA